MMAWISILGEGPYYFYTIRKRICIKSTLCLHYNGINSFLFVNATKIYQFKAKVFEVKDYTLCLGNISKDFTINNMKKTGLKGTVNVFPVDYNSIDTSGSFDIHRYLTKET